MPKKLTIGTITYGKSTLKYLPYFFNSLEKQVFKDFKIIIFDNSEASEKDNKDFVRKEIDKGILNIELDFCGDNLGFAKAYNRMIRTAEGDKSEYFLALNPDLILEPDAIQKMIKKLDNDKNLASLCPKIYHWDFKNNEKEEKIDSCGIALALGLRFFDVGQGEIDNGQFEGAEIIGPSGAAAMYRMKALLELAENGNYFDELMFMYKEDCDLAYRFFLTGFKSKCLNDAIAYHDRTVKTRGSGFLKTVFNRKTKSEQSKEWSFLNQHIIFYKYWRLQSFREKINIVCYATKMFFFALLFERYLLKEYLKLFKIRKKIKRY